MLLGFVVASAGLAAIAVGVAPELATATKPDVAPTPAPAALASTARPIGGRKVAIPADPDGHYFTSAVVNGHTIDVIVDTGATAVALTAESARRLGFTLAPGDFTDPVSTANGVIPAARVTLSEIRVGTITVDNVAAIVVPGDALGVNLLGMTFLGRLSKFEIGGGQLVLTD